MKLTEEKKEELAKQIREVINKNHLKMKEASFLLNFAITQRAKTELIDTINQCREKNILACVGLANLYLGLPPPRELKLQ